MTRIAMNDAARRKYAELEQKKFSEDELRHTLKEIKMLSLLCHCSAEIDHGTELYFSVNNLFLGSGDYLLLLFSEQSQVSEGQKKGEDIYCRMHLYTLVQEEVRRFLEGHFSYHTAEMDGRLVALICFQYGLSGQAPEGLTQAITGLCGEIHRVLKEKYDLDVITYMSSILSQVQQLSPAYDQMTRTATFHRYIRYSFSSPVVQMPPADALPNLEAITPVQENAQKIANAVIENGPYLQLYDEAMDTFIQQPLMSVDELKNRCVILFDALCDELKIRGIRFKPGKIKEIEARNNQSATSWAQCRKNYLDFLEAIANSRVDRETETMIRRIQRAKDYIDAHLSEQSLTMSDVAEELDVSISTLTSLFRIQLKMTPAKYIRTRRLEKSVQLLQEGNRSVREIAQLCGFGSLETFHRVFRTAYGMSPGALKIHNENIK